MCYEVQDFRIIFATTIYRLYPNEVAASQTEQDLCSPKTTQKSFLLVSYLSSSLLILYHLTHSHYNIPHSCRIAKCSFWYHFYYYGFSMVRFLLTFSFQISVCKTAHYVLYLVALHKASHTYFWALSTSLLTLLPVLGCFLILALTPSLNLSWFLQENPS